MCLHYGTGKQLDCTGAAVDFHAVYDHAVPAGIADPSPIDIIEASRLEGMSEIGNLFPYVCADHEVYLRRSNDCNVYERME